MNHFPTSARGRDAGVTLAELLVVVTVIGILAAIAVPVFLNQDARAAQSSLEADVVAASGMLTAARGFGYPLPAEFPAGQVTTVEGVGTFGASQTLYVVASPTDFCVEGTNPEYGITVSMGDASGLRDGPCPDADEFGLTVEYDLTQFQTGSDLEVLSPVLTGVGGDVTFTLEQGVLPPGVTLDPATGDLTGPAADAWNFQAVQVDVGREHACAVTSAQTAKCWGSDTYGATGVGGPSMPFIPPDSVPEVDVPYVRPAVPFPSDVVLVGDTPMPDIQQVSVGGQHTCALTTGQEVWCWGSNEYGQLSDTAAVGFFYPTPQFVGAGYRSVTAGYHFTCAITVEGFAKCWGNNAYGQVGADTPVGVVDEPTRVVGLDTVRELSAGFEHACAITMTEEVWCWGNSGGGALGSEVEPGNSGPSGEVFAPIRAELVPDGVRGLSAGTFLTCAIRNEKPLCWGGNLFGQMGNGMEWQDASPPVHPTNLTDVVTVQAADEFVCAQKRDGSVWCWGAGNRGQMGDGTFEGSLVPQAVGAVGLGNGSQLGDFTGFSPAVIGPGGSIRTWGDNEFGQLGDGTLSSASLPVGVVGAGPTDGFPSTITIRASDGVRAGSTTFTLTQSSDGTAPL